jgi:hypothetical protein
VAGVLADHVGAAAGGGRCLRAATAVAFALLLVFAIGCGRDDGADARKHAPKVTTTAAGTVRVSAIDERAGLNVEIQDDGLSVKLAADPPAAARALAGDPLGGACEVDGDGDVQVAERFPIYWREDFRDWGTALVRDPPGGVEGGEVLAQHVTSCRIFATNPTGESGARSFDLTDEPVATVSLR